MLRKWNACLAEEWFLGEAASSTAHCTAHIAEHGRQDVLPSKEQLDAANKDILEGHDTTRIGTQY